MASRSTDIVARLQLRGEQFASENARLFGELEKRANDTAGRTRTAFENSFASIQKLADKAASAPRNAAGAPDLNVASYREAALAADQRATGLRQMAAAMEAVAIKENDLSEATRIHIQAARAASIEAENGARTAHQQAAAMDRLQQELDETAAAARRAGGAMVDVDDNINAVTRGSRANSQAMVQAGQQFQDFFVQVGSGQSALVAFTQQFPQLTYVMSQADGKLGRMAGFLSGPWGIALTGALMVVGLFGDKLFETGDALAKETRELEKNREKTRAAEAAKDAYARTAPGVIDAIRETTDELDRQNRSLEENIRLQKGVLQAQLETARRELDDNQKKLSAAREAAVRAQSVRGGNFNALGGIGGATAAANAQVNANQAQAEVRRLEEQAVQLRESIVAAERGIRQAGFPLAERAAREASDPIAAINGQYDRMAEAAKAAAAANDSLAASLDRTLTGIEKQRQAALEMERDRQRASRGGNEGDLTRFISPVSGRNTGSFGEVRGKRSHAGVDIAVPVGTNVQAAASGTVITAAELPGYGRVVIVDHGRGTTTRYAHLSKLLVSKGDPVGQGDVVGLSGGAKGAPGAGNSQGPHLHYEVRRSGRAVNPNAGQFPTDGLAIAAKIEEKELRDLELRQQIREEVERTIAAQGDALRISQLLVQGREQEARLEREMAESRERLASQMADLPKDQQAVSAETQKQVSAMEQQAAVTADLVRSMGDVRALRTDERLQVEAAHQALEQAYQAALKTATTEGERLTIYEAMERALARVGQGIDEGGDQAKKALDTARERSRAEKQARDELRRWEEEQEREARDRMLDLADFYEDAMHTGGKSIWEDFKDEGTRVIAELAAMWTLQVLSGQGTGFGNILSQISGQGVGGGNGGVLSALGGLFGKKGGVGGGTDRIGGGFDDYAPMPGQGSGGAMGAIGGAMGAFGLAVAANQLIGSIFGFKGGPLGVLGGLFSSSKQGSASLGFSNGSLGVGRVSGNSGSREDAASGAMGSVASGLQRIADMLGGSVMGSGSVSIGQYKDEWRVRTDGASKMGGYKNSPSTLKNFGDDMEGAIRFALGDAIKDGVIGAISDTQRRLLQSGQDLEKAIEKAVLVGEIPKKLQAYLDPVGFALDELNARWAKTIAALKEGGASAEEMARAQQLYKIELEETKANTASAAASLKDFLKSMGYGSSSPYSLGEQEGRAYAELKPFLDQINAGQRIDQAKYQEAAQAYLDIERQMYGSTGKFFDAQAIIQEATSKAIATIDNAAPIRTAADPFVQQTASNTQTTNEILAQQSSQLAELSGLMARMVQASGGDQFIGSGRHFVSDNARAA